MSVLWVLVRKEIVIKEKKGFLCELSDEFIYM